MNNKHYLLALNRMNRIGPLTVAKLMKRWPNLQEMFELSIQQLEAAGLPSVLAQTIKAFNLSEVDADWRWQEGSNHHLITWADPEYPALLKEIYDPPVVLYGRGD